MNLAQLKIGFVGTGRMATALAMGFQRQLVTPERICGIDPSDVSRHQFQTAMGSAVEVVADAGEVLPTANIVFLAVKPQLMQTVLEGLREVLSVEQLVVSIAAGLTVSRLEAWLPSGTRLIRVMPNTPCLIGKGACGVCRGSLATADDEHAVSELLRSVGLVENVPEHLLDAVTGLSGSGPAYVFQMIEALSDGGVKMGLPRDMATRLAAQTLAGAAEMVLQTGEHPAALKDAVTSPGGTTIAALHEMEQAGVRAALMNAVEASTNRSRELA